MRIPSHDLNATWRALRGYGPALWADIADNRVLLAGLRPVFLPADGRWRDEVDATARPGAPTVRGLPATGWAGWFGYEAGAWRPGVPAPQASPPLDGRPFGLPVACLGRFGGVAVLDRRTGEWSVGGEGEAVERLRAAIDAGRGREEEEPPPPSGRRVHEGDRARYEAGVERILAHLRAGDCYQVNLARRVDFTEVGDALAVWRRLRAANPARRGILVETDDGAVVSNSPELLLAARPGPDGVRVRSHPIKGTAPRAGLEPAARSAAAEALLRSPKERAELTMIVDLVRADLGFVAAPGTVQVGPRRVGAIGHVWHAVRPVTATLAPGRTALDAFEQLFPAGSVTGAPRARAMEVIRDLEDGARGVYCGSVGWFGDDGSARWNVAIRTVTVQDSRARLHVGAGIVLGSDPRREYEETVLKADRMAAALEAR